MPAIRIGINPISWSNDDLPALGGETPLSTALSEGKEIGYEGFELNGKFPKDAKGVGDVLRPYDLALVSGWYSSRLARRSVAEEIEAIAGHVELLKLNGAKVLALLAERIRQAGVIGILVTHSLEAAATADRVLRLTSNRLQA